MFNVLRDYSHNIAYMIKFYNEYYSEDICLDDDDYWKILTYCADKYTLHKHRFESCDKNKCVIL